MHVLICDLSVTHQCNVLLAETCHWNDLLCVECDVKHSELNSVTQQPEQTRLKQLTLYVLQIAVLIDWRVCMLSGSTACCRACFSCQSTTLVCWYCLINTLLMSEYDWSVSREACHSYMFTSDTSACCSQCFRLTVARSPVGLLYGNCNNGLSAVGVPAWNSLCLSNVK